MKQMMELGTKADTLGNLKNKLTYADVLPQYKFTVAEWKKQIPDYKKIIAYLSAASFNNGVSVLIARSSALNEDTSISSMAGKFESVGHISNEKEFIKAVEKVIASFDNENEENQILIQPMLTNVKISGVAFTLEPNTLGNYYVINYDETGSTLSITSGNGTENKLAYSFKREKSLYLKNGKHDSIKILLYTLSELEELFAQNNLDVEFAVTEENELFILQVRPLVIKAKPVAYKEQLETLKRIGNKIKSQQSEKPFLCGDKTVYGVMPDWNPAEIIGIRPKPLALSLYKEIITDSVWAYQRDNYGYRKLRSFPLMVDFSGLPYIDVRVSFNSFIPAKLDEKISDKLVNYYIQRLEEDPSKHDKVEFDIVFSCFTLDLPDRIQVLNQYHFSEDEITKIVESLRDVTNGIINHETGLWRKDYEKIRILDKRYGEIISSDMDDIEKIYWLLEDCKRYGTLPFAGLARAAFIAVQLLQSLVNEQILSDEDYQNFMNDVNTVSSIMNNDFQDLSRESFLKKYGHLRPGTYDINSPRYDEEPNLYFDWEDIHTQKMASLSSFKISLEQLHKLEDVLEKNGLTNNVLELMDFIKFAIEGREYAKFIFTKNLSKVLQMIEHIGREYGLSKEDCSYMNIKCIQILYSTTEDVEKIIKTSIETGKKNYQITKSITLPPLIMDEKDIWDFYYPDTEPNYITLKRTCGSVVILENIASGIEYKDKILLIPCADPGFDWIFAKGIRGFITMYGGANSHMAIRAGELGIPAAVGIGTKQYEALKKADIVEIDALTKNIRILKSR